MDFAVTVGDDASGFFLFSFTYQSARKQRSNRVRSLNVISQPASSPGHPPPGRVRAKLPSMMGAAEGWGARRGDDFRNMTLNDAARKQTRPNRVLDELVYQRNGKTRRFCRQSTPRLRRARSSPPIPLSVSFAIPSPSLR